MAITYVCYCSVGTATQLAALRPEVAEQTETMEQAMRLLAPRVQPGDMVLLSPALCQLDQFKNFEQRGNEFARLAKELVDAFISPSPENAAPARI